MEEENSRWGDHVYRILPTLWNDLTHEVIAGAMEVHRLLGPGLLERIYEEALSHELKLRGVAVERQVPIKIRYKDLELPEQRVDLIAEGMLVIELKAVERVPPVYLAQLVSYLRSGDYPLGLLLNFNVALLKHGIHRRLNPHSSAVRSLPAMSDLNSLSDSAFSAASAPSEFPS